MRSEGVAGDIMDVRRTLTWFFSFDSGDLLSESGHEARATRTRIWALMVAAIVTATLFLFRPPFIDDSYITFRYAQRLADMGTISWNDTGAPVLGTTTVLWTGILAAIYRLHLFSMEEGALIVTTTIVFLLVYNLVIFGHECLTRCNVNRSRIVSSLITAIAVSHAPVRISLFSGMETALYCLLVVRALMLLPTSPAIAGVYTGLATLTRPDGLILLVVGLLWAGRYRLVFLVTFLIPTVPWFIFSSTHFGELLPGSVEAKQILYPSGWLQNFLMFFEAHTQDSLQGALFCLGGAGLFGAMSISRLRPFLVWLPLYALGITVSGVKPIFFWYFTPTWLVVLAIGLLGGSCWLAVRRHMPAKAFVAGFGVGVLLLGSYSLRQDVSGQGGFLRERVYREIVAQYHDQIRAEDTILVGETGILGFGFPRATVLDSAGLTSREILSLLREVRAHAGKQYAHRELATIPGWSTVLVERMEPRWIIAARGRFDLVALEQAPWFTERYERVSLFIPEHLGGIGVYRRKAA